MLLIGESINGAIPSVAQAIAARNKDFIVELARQQVECGAQMLDVCASMSGSNEVEDLVWTVKTVQEAVKVPLMLDSANPAALRAALSVCDERPILSSITGEESRMNELLPLAAESGCELVALCMDEKGIPETPEGRLKVAEMIVERAAGAGVSKDKLWIDPLVISIGTNHRAGQVTLKALRLIREHLPGVRTLGAVSNVSFGLPSRRLLNRSFLAMLVAEGVDGVLVDVRDKTLMATLYASAALAGRDPFCRQYLRAYREGRLA